MANGLVTLGYLRLQAQQRSGTESNPAISTSEWNQYLSSSYKELYDKIVAAYGNDYYLALPYQFSLTGAQFYSLPDGSANFLISGNPAPAFYKLLGVDLQYSSSPTGWVTLRNFELIDRNKFLAPNTSTNYSGFTNLRYRLAGSQLWFIPIPASGQQARIWYVPEPTNLMFAPSCNTTANNAVITVSDAQGLTSGMSVFGTGIPTGTTVSSVNTSNNQVTLSAQATLTQTAAVCMFWIDSTTMDGISGWEEYVIIDAAIKACTKMEFDTASLERMLGRMTARIEGMAEGRDAGQAHHVSDALSVVGYGSTDGFDDGFGGMGGFGGL